MLIFPYIEMFNIPITFRGENILHFGPNLMNKFEKYVTRVALANIDSARMRTYQVSWTVYILLIHELPVLHVFCRGFSKSNSSNMSITSFHLSPWNYLLSFYQVLLYSKPIRQTLFRNGLCSHLWHTKAQIIMFFQALIN